MDFIRRLTTRLRNGMKRRSPSDSLVEDSESACAAKKAQEESERWRQRRAFLQQKISQLRDDLHDAQSELDALHPPIEVLLHEIKTRIAKGDTFTFEINARPAMPVNLHWDGFLYEWPDATVAVMQLTACGAQCKFVKNKSNEEAVFRL